jgi:hypothetical protein
MRALSTGMLGELRGVRLVIERAGDEHVESSVSRLACGGDEVRPAHGPEFGTNENSGPLLGVSFQVTAFSANVVARPCNQRGE